ncbi:MAG TPA: dihydrodipicolinate synthase family protein, partial [Pseudogulbenkiania sp.]|nr:dihydrodipicolinate synthase family protein [Pseudogulbenkiania sp.]
MAHLWTGVFPAVTTKFNADESLDLAGTVKHIQWQLECGADGIIVCGSLGEASTLTADEKIAILKAAKEVAGDKPVLLTVAEDSTRAAAALAQAAHTAGADGIMLLPAMRYVSDARETINHYQRVADASPLPIMIYNNPIAYGVNITPEMYAEMAKEPKYV